MRIRITGLVFAFLVAAAGCSDDLATTAAPVPLKSGPTVAAVQDCGTYSLRRELPEGVMECLVDAVHSKELARLDWTRPTTEGDPIRTTYVSDSEGRVVVSVDASQDKWAGVGADKFHRSVCTGIQPGVGILFNSCAELPD
jgi:hypothetical protein